MTDVERYKRRRERRLGKRGIRDDGNNRLPFGLCEREGIKVGADWGPSEAWEALAKKGITPASEFAKRSKATKEKATASKGNYPNNNVKRTHSAGTLKKFDEHRQKAISGSFVEKLSDDERNQVGEMLTEVFDKGEYKSSRGLTHFGDIVEGGYKSQVETGTSGKGAALNKEARKQISEGMFGHEGVGDDEYEKCGYLSPPGDKADFTDDAHPPYGDMTITLRKDKMNDRATYTWGDSMNASVFGDLRSAGYAGEHPTIEGITALSDEGQVRKMLKAYEAYKEGYIDYDRMFKTIRADADNLYVEMQFHGKITVGDIAKASWKSEEDLAKSFDSMKDGQRKRVLKLLKDNNVELSYNTGRWKMGDAWEWLKKKYPDDMPN